MKRTKGEVIERAIGDRREQFAVLGLELVIGVGCVKFDEEPGASVSPT